MGLLCCLPVGLSIEVSHWDSSPKKWEARVREVPASRRGIVAVFRYAPRQKALELTEIALRHTDGSPLTNVDLQRRYPLASLERAARTSVIERWHESEGDVGAKERFEADHPTAVRVIEQLAKYSAIAAEYRESVKNGRGDPAGEIARRHGVKPSTARGWVYRTRKLGLLGEARGRTSGEL
jgi:hypothetical protein